MREGTFVAHERELAELWGYLGDALAWRGMICFVVGQAGSGKTALAHYFLHQALSVEPNLVVATGTCNAQAGIGDPYLPFREALASSTALMGSIGSKGLRAAGLLRTPGPDRRAGGGGRAGGRRLARQR
jgi:adenylate cyclase